MPEQLAPILRVQPGIQYYAWGGTKFIPSLLGIVNDAQRPHAELWIGAHAKGPSRVYLGDGRAGLPELLQEHAEVLLGPETAARFQRRLPFLFKVLDVRQMLSIQVHPSREQAIAGFEAEQARGIPLDAPNRNYRDRNHKPEVHVALTDFWMLHGFRPLPEIARTFQETPELHGLQPVEASHLAGQERYPEREQAMLRELYSSIMELPQAAVNARLDPMLARLMPKFEAGELERQSPDYWAVRAAREFPLPNGDRDRGIFSFYLCNLVHLKAGEGTFQAAGTPHAYLEGVNVELMANSDNVLRGGLTPKHIDVPELLRTLNFTPGKPQILRGQPISQNETTYETPTDDFQLSQIKVSRSCPYVRQAPHSLEAYIVMDGEVTVRAGDETMHLRKGGIFLTIANAAYSIETPVTATLYKASVPEVSNV